MVTNGNWDVGGHKRASDASRCLRNQGVAPGRLWRGVMRDGITQPSQIAQLRRAAQKKKTELQQSSWTEKLLASEAKSPTGERPFGQLGRSLKCLKSGLPTGPHHPPPGFVPGSRSITPPPALALAR